MPASPRADALFPTGTVTFLFTDIEGSTMLWQRYPEAMSVALARHDEVMREAIAAHCGVVFKTVGDAFCAAFSTASDALGAAIAAQSVMQSENWQDAPIKVRMGLDTGVAEQRNGDYFGTTLNRVARVSSIAHGRQILLSTVTAELLRDRLSAGLALRDMGEHRLKGLINPERLWQAVAPALVQEFPALRSLNAIPNNLPLRTTSFLGRDQDVATVRESLATTCLVTLVGSGGIGKTSLSLQVAAGTLDDFKDGVWFVEFAPLTDDALVPSAVADVLGLREEAGRPLFATLIDFLRPRELLLVLDNCEHLIQGCARFADAVLRASRGTRILASSREPLAIGGELAWRVPSLSMPDPEANTPLAQFNQYAAVGLFVDRAKHALASFHVTADNAPAIAQICWALDGIPLAIELAASRVKSMRVEQIAERLDDRLRLLTGGSRAAVARQQTLRSTIDWSHSLLAEEERVLFSRLSAFAGGWTLEAAEAVGAGDGIGSYDVLDTLSRLVDKSLVVMDEQTAEPRYHMLETIRQYAREKLLESKGDGVISDRHLNYFTALAESFEPRFYHPDQVKWYGKVDAELDNVRTALEWALTAGNVECGLRLVNALHRYWVVRVYWMEASGWLQRLLAIADAGNPTPLHAKSLFVLGHITYYYDTVAGQRFAENSLSMARALDYKHGIANALWLMGWCCTTKLDAAAESYFEESIRLASEVDYPWAAAHAYAWCGVYKVGIGDYEAAKPLLQTSKVNANRIGRDSTLLGRCDGNLGLIALLQEDYPLAKSYLDASLVLQEGAGNKNGMAETLWLQGRLALRQGSHAQAVGHFQESLKLYRIYPNSLWVTRGLAYLAITFVACGELPSAAKLAGILGEREGKASLIRVDLGSRVAISEYEAAIAQVREKMGEPEYTTAFAAGRKMTREAAITFVLAATISTADAVARTKTPRTTD